MLEADDTKPNPLCRSGNQLTVISLSLFFIDKCTGGVHPEAGMR